MRLHKTIFGVAIGAAFILAGASTAQADHERSRSRRSDRNCVERFERERGKLERDIRRHGIQSRQAFQRREKLRRVATQCGFAGPVFFDRRFEQGGFDRERRGLLRWLDDDFDRRDRRHDHRRCDH